MECPNCQVENPVKAKFCNECGQSLSPTTSPSNEKKPYDDKIKKIQRYLPKGLTEKILSQRGKIEGERKQVTVMFCDMVDFTPMVENLGPDRAYNIMDQVYEILIHKVHEYEGTVNEMTGDGVMALFGAPLAVEDAPQRAIRSAFAIRDEIGIFNETFDISPPIRMRTGIHTGSVLVGALGNDLRVEFKAVGDTVNLASRMEALAEPDCVYVTEETYRLSKELFKFDDLGEKHIKGKRESVRVYKSLSPREYVYRPRLGKERMIYSEMVGRDVELNKLELQVMKVINGEGSVVNIIGEAGIGKSRLVAELKNHDILKKTTMLEGRAISIGKNLSFHPIIDLIKQWANIKENDSEATAFNKFELAVQYIDMDKSKEIIPFVATLMGMKISGSYADRVKGIEGEALEKLIVKNVNDLLAKASESSPIVIIMEDMHWADQSSIDLISSLYRLTKEHAILFVNVFRPGYSETGDRIIETLEKERSIYSIKISLKPLIEQHSEELIYNMLKIRGLPFNVIENVVKRSDGNPFFIEEVVRSFVDIGAVVKRNNKYEVTAHINNVNVPHSINEVLMTRIDRLEESNRNLIKMASVIGRNFFYRILTQVADEIEDIDDKLSYLKTVQLIRERKRYDEIEFLFKHALAQEAAYDSIIVDKRKNLHLKVAAAIEIIFYERLHEFYGVLSYHYLKGENYEKAEKFLSKAGEEAIRSSASNEAIYYYKEALRIYVDKHGNQADLHVISEMEKNIALALYNKGLNTEASKYFEKSLVKLGVKFPNQPILIIFKIITDLISFMTSLYIPFLKWRKVASKRDNDILDLLFKRITAVAVTDMVEYLKIQFNLGKRLANFNINSVNNGIGYVSLSSLMFSWSGISFGISRKILNFIKKKVQLSELKESVYFQFATLMHNYLSGDNLKNEDPYNDELVEKGLKSGEIPWTTYYIFQSMLRPIQRGEWTNASKIIAKNSMIHDLYGNDYGKLGYYWGKLKLSMKYHKFSEALSYFTAGFDIANRIDDKFYCVVFLSLNAKMQSLSGDLKAANTTLKKALDIKPRFVLPFYLNYLLLSQFIYEILKFDQLIKSENTSSSKKQIKIAIKAGKKAVKNSKRIAADQVEIFRLMGKLYWQIGRQNKAMQYWRRSIEQGKYMNYKLELSKTYFEVGKRLIDETSKYKKLKGKYGEDYLKMAKKMFEEMDLQWDLEQLERHKTYS